jgi:hypothetical protein
MVWAAISYAGERKIAVIKVKINSEAYVKFLSNKLLNIDAIEDSCRI